MLNEEWKGSTITDKVIQDSEEPNTKAEKKEMKGKDAFTTWKSYESDPRAEAVDRSR